MRSGGHDENVSGVVLLISKSIVGKTVIFLIKYARQLEQFKRYHHFTAFLQIVRPRPHLF